MHDTHPLPIPLLPSPIAPRPLPHITAFASFTGLVVIVNKRVAHSIDLSHAFIFASGALLTASLLHIIPEAIEVGR